MNLFMLIALVGTVDSEISATLSEIALEQNYQLQAMKNLVSARRNNDILEILFVSGLLYLTRYADAPCEWKNVQCTNDTVIGLQWGLSFLSSKGAHVAVVEIMTPDIRWLPSTLETVYMSGQPIQSALKTRFLPKHLRDLRLARCQLRGNIDFTLLPNHIERIDLNDNNFCGTSDLTHLPPKMRKMMLSRNVFDRVVVDNEGLPDTLESIEIKQCFRKKYIPLTFTEDDQTLDPRIKMHILPSKNKK